MDEQGREDAEVEQKPAGLGVNSDLTPEEEEDGEPFPDKMKRLTSLLKEQQAKGAKLDQEISENLKRIGYEY